MIRPIQPAINPVSHRAAIDALESQRAGYRRYARQIEAQQRALTDGDGDKALAAADRAAQTFAELDEGARTLAPLLDEARAAGGDDERREVERRIDEMAPEARTAEVAIRNLATQLEAWRDAYGRQLAEEGIEPGGAAESGGAAGGAAAGGPAAGRPAPATSGYGPRGRPVDRRGVPALLDRKG
jgi:hypothetical protein